MPAKEIKALRQAGKLEEALEMALAELNKEPENIWAKRNISWVYYDFVKQNISLENFDAFSLNIGNIINLALPEEEKMLFENIAWLIIKMGFAILKLKPDNPDYRKLDILYSYAKQLPLTKPSVAYSALFNVFRKAYKDNALKYIEFTDWWNFDNFRDGEDYRKEKMPDGKEMMSLVEQAYITYAKHLLPTRTPSGEIIFNREKAESFLQKLSKIEEQHPEYQYPAYYKAKLLLVLGEKDNMLSTLLPFAKRKCNDFWVWDILAEAFPNEKDKIFACYCKGLACHAPEEMLINLRTKIVSFFIEKELWDEAKTEIEEIVRIRTKKEWRIPANISNWTQQPWYLSAKKKENNIDTYKQYSSIAEDILFNDIPKKTIIVESINKEQKILNFIASDNETGFLKYERFLKKVHLGDTLEVRLLSKEGSGRCQVATLKKTDNPTFRAQYFKEFEGIISISEGKNFGFVRPDIFLPPEYCQSNKLTNGQQIKGIAIKSFDKKKNKWGWKAIVV